tara:strand:- start:17357 stop:18526 length:1170 start_codon:yes stop_codon:yes gene_type:complete
MRRHQFFFCYLMLLILIGNQQLRADDRLPIVQRKTSTSATPYDQATGKYLPLEPVKSAPGKILEQWSAASRFLSPVTPQSKVEEFKKGNQTYFSGHELSLISEFQQPVTTQALLADYNWQLVRQTETNITLRGQPRDALTRHLCRPFELQINSQSMLPEALTFLSDPTKQKQGFASIELTALKVMQTSAIIETDAFPKTVSQRVAKAIFPQEGMVQSPASQMSPIKRISFSRLSSENRDKTELQEIEKLVARWIAESQRVESIKLGPITILKHGLLSEPIEGNEAGANLSGARIPSIQDILRPWLINVDRQTFVIESFTMDLSTDEKNPSAPRFITLIMKPNPNHRQPKWGIVEIEFSSVQPLPIKISASHGNHMSQFLLSNLQIRYAE